MTNFDDLSIPRPVLVSTVTKKFRILEQIV